MNSTSTAVPNQAESILNNSEIPGIPRLVLYSQIENFKALSALIFDNVLPLEEACVSDFEERAKKSLGFLSFSQELKSIFHISYGMFKEVRRKTYSQGPFLQHAMGAAEIIVSCAKESYENLSDLLTATYLSVLINHASKREGDIPLGKGIQFSSFMNKNKRICELATPMYHLTPQECQLLPGQKWQNKMNAFEKGISKNERPEPYIIAMASILEYLSTDNCKLEKYKTQNTNILSLKTFLKQVDIDPMPRYQNIKGFGEYILWNLLKYDDSFHEIDIFKLAEWYDVEIKRMGNLLGV